MLSETTTQTEEPLANNIESGIRVRFLTVLDFFF